MLKRMRCLWRNLKLLSTEEVSRVLSRSALQGKILSAVANAAPSCSIHPHVIIRGLPQGSLTLGDEVRIESGSILSLGDEHNGYGSLTVGDRCWIGQYNNIRTGGADITIGNNCLISQFCSVIGTNHGLEKDCLVKDAPAMSSKSGVQVGDDVWLGAGCVLLPGVTIGAGAVIGANSVVTHNVPENEVWAGVPAQKIKSRV